MTNLLIVDDEESYLQVLKVIFEADGYSVVLKNGGRAAIAHLENEPCDILISDVKMPDMDGISLLKEAREIAPDVGVVLMTAFGTINTAREAFKLGADDFIQKPFNNEELKLIIKRTLEKQKILKENQAFKRAQRSSGSLINIIGKSPQIVKIFEMIEQVAAEMSTVLITGESGTGKELFARAVHDLSPRADKPFVPINCGAMPENLLEAELFGFKKGSFTGANSDRAGLFEVASGGTIFLDEIGDMPLTMQVKMLRVLQDKKVRRVGGVREIPVDTRVIAATNCDLKKMVEEGTFRRDLFYRLSVIPLHIPPLRERREDIPLLAEHFIKKFCRRSGKLSEISPEAMRLLENRVWEGNVRELEHTIERAVALTSDSEPIRAEHCAEVLNGPVDPPVFGLPADGLDLQSFIGNLEKELVAEALRRMNGNQTQAAQLLQMKVYKYRHLLSKHNLQIKNNPQEK